MKLAPPGARPPGGFCSGLVWCLKTNKHGWFIKAKREQKKKKNNPKTSKCLFGSFSVRPWVSLSSTWVEVEKKKAPLLETDYFRLFFKHSCVCFSPFFPLSWHRQLWWIWVWRHFRSPVIYRRKDQAPSAGTDSLVRAEETATSSSLRLCSYVFYCDRCGWFICLMNLTLFYDCDFFEM